MSTTQGVKLDEETRNRLVALGELRDRAPHWLMREAIREYLEREERHEEQKRVDMERWQEVELTGRAVPHAEVAKWLGELAAGRDAPCPK